MINLTLYKFELAAPDKSAPFFMATGDRVIDLYFRRNGELHLAKPDWFKTPNEARGYLEKFLIFRLDKGFVDEDKKRANA